MRRERAVAALCAAVLWAASARAAAAQDRVLFQGLFDAEAWKTDDGSVLLSKNGGDLAPQGRLRLWAAVDAGAGFQAFAMGEVEGGRAEEEHGPDYELEQGYVRYTFKSPARLVLEAGKILTPIGDFPRRYLSSVNPLIGSPDGYGVSYPLGFRAAGSAARFNYSAALIDGPVTNENYLPASDRALRPAIEAGVTLWTGLRIGAYATRGPYLNDTVPLPPGAGWKEFDQSLRGVDLQFSHGYFELHGDYGRSGYEVPNHPRPVRGFTWFVEPKYTFAPRWFAALRLERNNYAYVMPLSPTVWIGDPVDFYNVEAGVGFRLLRDATLKVSYRRDRWQVDDSLKPFLPDGHSLSMQLSWRFDVASWFDAPR